MLLFFISINMMNYINRLSKMEKKGEGERMREGKVESKEERMHVKNISQQKASQIQKKRQDTNNDYEFLMT